MRRASSLFALVLLVPLGWGFSGCSREGSPESGRRWEVVRDTVGDTLVVRTLSGSVWGDTADLVPDVSIGVLEGPPEYTFGQVVSLALAPDGTIYAMDRHVPALRVFEPDGTYRATFGRGGGGPGEYEQPDGGLNVLSDGRVLLRDPANARIQVFEPDGTPAGAWRIRGGFNTSSRMIVDTLDRAYTILLLDPEAEVRDWRSGLVRIGPDGTPGDTLVLPDTGFEAPRLEARLETEGGVNVSINSVPFGPGEFAILSPHGYFIHGISTEYSLTLLRPDGPVRIEKAWDPVPVTSGEKREEEEQTTRSMRQTDPGWDWDGPPIPDTKPPYTRVYAGEDGTVWVRVSRPGVRRDDPDFDPTEPDAVREEWSESIVFDVFDEDGRYLGAVRAPEDFSPYPSPIFTRDRVLATTRDELDVQRVVLYRVSLPGDRAPSDVTVADEAG
jgi:hypothetical protein